MYSPIQQNTEITRLTYNCAHLRSTRETLTVQYFRIILEKKLGENFWGGNFFGENSLGGNFLVEKFLGEKFLVEIFLVKIFWVKIL